VAKRSKSTRTEVELISWAVSRIAQGQYAVSEDDNGRELWVNEREPSVEEMEGELLHRRPEAVRQKFLALRDNCSVDGIRSVFSVLFGETLAGMLIESFVGVPTCYEVVIATAYNQDRALVQQVQRFLVQGREGLRASGLATVESGAMPEAIEVAVVSHYAEEISKLFPRMIKRAEQMRILAVEHPVSDAVQHYLEEASKCYVYGRFIACLVVCRSAIEFALKDRLLEWGKARDLQQLKDDRKESLWELIKIGRTVFQKATMDDADEVRTKAANAVHNAEPGPDQCRSMFVKTRGILSELYSSPPVRRLPPTALG